LQLFRQAPKWEFPLEDPQQSPGALFLGFLPARPPAAYSAILSFRPSSLPKNGSAILALGTGSREPHFTLVLAGEPVLTLCHHRALFYVILLFLQARSPLHYLLPCSHMSVGPVYWRLTA
jgi:hypothetical protein